MHLIGPPPAASRRSQCVIIPYFRSSNAGDIEVLKENWLDSVGGILAQCAAVSFGASQGEKLADIVLSAFSFGIRYCDLARKHMTGLAAGYLPKVWDFDGIYSGTDGHLS